MLFFLSKTRYLAAFKLQQPFTAFTRASQVSCPLARRVWMLRLPAAVFRLAKVAIWQDTLRGKAAAADTELSSTYIYIYIYAPN